MNRGMLSRPPSPKRHMHDHARFHRIEVEVHGPPVGGVQIAEFEFLSRMFNGRAAEACILQTLQRRGIFTLLPSHVSIL